MSRKKGKVYATPANRGIVDLNALFTTDPEEPLGRTLADTLTRELDEITGLRSTSELDGPSKIRCLLLK